MLKSLVRGVGTAVRVSTATSSTARSLPLASPTLCNPSSAKTRPFTRSLWMMNSPKLFSSKIQRPSVLHGCGGLHTGDKAFTDFLSDEIKVETKIQKNKTLPKMSGGWKMEMNGTEAKLIRFISGDKVSVTFNINNSVSPNFEEEADQGQQSKENEPEVVSTPNFVVEVTKQSAKHSLVFDCHYPEYEVGHGGGDEEESDNFTICEVSFQPEGDWKENSYALNTDSLDWADLYDHLMDFLAGRGVDNTFADELIELSTAIEHQEYISFLEQLNGFVKCN